MGDKFGKWSPGNAYGPVLSPTDLYLLKADLEIHPILAGKHPKFHLVFSLLTGNAGGFNAEARDRDLAFTAKEEPATWPRVQQLIIITEHSPWCTIVTNEKGVTNHDILQAIWKDYAEHMVTDPEFTSVPARIQEAIKRAAQNNQAAQNGGQHWGYYSPAIQPNRVRRVDWVRERIYFEALRKNDAYVKTRLGFAAPNIFVLDLCA